MLPVNFEGANITLNKPNDMTDDQCMSIPAYMGIDNDGIRYFLSAWMPNKEDIEAIKAGRPIMLKTCGLMPPSLIYTYDENFVANV